MGLALQRVCCGSSFSSCGRKCVSVSEWGGGLGETGSSVQVDALPDLISRLAFLAGCPSLVLNAVGLLCSLLLDSQCAHSISQPLTIQQFPFARPRWSAYQLLGEDGMALALVCNKLSRFKVSKQSKYWSQS